ncbi:MAG: hypothetical protein WCK29_01040 [archaeon]
MGHTTRKESFKINERFEQMVLSIYGAAITGKGIFRGGVDVWKYKYLPQWMLPSDLEHAPLKTEVKLPKETSQYLWTAAAMEKGIQSRVLHSKLKIVWNDPSARWFFDAHEAVHATREDVDAIIVRRIGYNYDNPVEHYMANVKKLSQEYDGDPRNLIDASVIESRKRMQEFAGIDGIANMVVMQFIDRKISRVNDPENLLFKIDTHKARIPLNVNGISVSRKNYNIHHSVLRDEFQDHYWELCNKHGLDPKIADTALWVIGSEVCAKKSLIRCLENCPLASNGLCISNKPLKRARSTFLFRENDKPVESRRGTNQGYLTELYRNQF